MELRPYLGFDGRCAEAFAFYAKCLHGELSETITYGDSPMREQTPPEYHSRIMHTQLTAGPMVLMGADSPPGMFKPASGIRISLGTNDQAEAERVYAALSEGGTVEMPLQQTFWATRFGMVTDRFGTPWMVNCALQ